MAILSLLAWGLGYFGQPHILVKFMAIKTSKSIPQATRIAMVWVVISLAWQCWWGSPAGCTWETS